MSETSSSLEDEHIVAVEPEDDDDDDSIQDGEEEEEDDDDNQSSQNELDAWRQVHSHLTKAVAVAREAVAARKIQRRFWLEEICANLTEEGKLTQSSVWKKPVQPRKTAAKKSAKQKETTPKRRKKKADPKPKKPKKKKKEEEGDEEAPKKKIRLQLKKPATKQTPPPIDTTQQEDSQATSEEEGDGSETETGMNRNLQQDTHSMQTTDYAGQSARSPVQWGSGQHRHYMVSTVVISSMSCG